MAIFVPTAATTLFFAVVVVGWQNPVSIGMFGFCVLPLGLLVRAWRSPLNRLAVLALVLSIPAAIVPFVFLVVLLPVAVAWWRSRQPGVRRRGPALTAVILCGVGFAVSMVAVLVQA